MQRMKLHRSVGEMFKQTKKTLCWNKIDMLKEEKSNH